MEQLAEPAPRTRKKQIRLKDGRDEMNLVEFPFATLSERSGKTNVLEFQVDTYDRVVGRPVVRRLTVTGDAKFGLPTAKDEEVYLGLLQLTKAYNDFESPKVLFTRGELIKLMGWKNRDWSYHRIGTSLARLTGVRLFYENAWRDNAKREFRTKGGFALLDSFELRDGRSANKEECLSEFRWNSVIFESFQSGYLKKLNYEKVRSLTVIAKRMYRFLDKHFHPPHRTAITLPLKTFAFEHIGLSRSYDNSQIRRALRPAIDELVAIQFLGNIDESRRFRRIAGSKRDWEILLSMPGNRTAESTPSRFNTARHVTEPTREETSARKGATTKTQRYLQSLTPDQLKKLEQEAVASATGFHRETFQREGNSGPLADECRRQIVYAFVAAKRLSD